MSHNIFFIRHAPTKANISGDMVENYDQYDIEHFDTASWYRDIGSHININKDFEIWVSPTLRCESTAKKLFGSLHDNMRVEPLLKELDCSSLGNKKFWEISKEEFDKVCHPDMAAFRKQIDKLLDKIKKSDKPIICITHGLFIRYLYNYITGLGDKELFDLINSRTFQFRNLDMLKCVCSLDNIRVETVYHYE